MYSASSLYFNNVLALTLFFFIYFFIFAKLGIFLALTAFLDLTLFLDFVTTLNLGDLTLNTGIYYL